MTLCRRLARLERASARRPPAGPTTDVFARIEQWRAYSRGEGPRPEPPPTPLGTDPAAVARRERVADYLATGRPPAGLTAAEKAYADGVREVVRRVSSRASQTEAAGSAASPGP